MTTKQYDKFDRRSTVILKIIDKHGGICEFDVLRAEVPSEFPNHKISDDISTLEEDGLIQTMMGKEQKMYYISEALLEKARSPWKYLKYT